MRTNAGKTLEVGEEINADNILLTASEVRSPWVARKEGSMVQSENSYPKFSRVERGRHFEALACSALKASGYRILARNYRCPGAEIDIVAFHQGYLVIVEVRGQSTSNRVDPFETITRRKRQRLVLGAMHYINHRYGHREPNVRFDVVAVRGPRGKERVEIIPGAFELGW